MITPNGTALMTIYEVIPADLTSFHARANGWIYDCLFQEIDIATGKLLFQWRSSEHYNVSETYAPIGHFGRKKKDAFDYFHINSINKDPQGNYYISSRYMHTVTCISPSGEIIWILGGKRNNFTDLSSGAATSFSWQHHANWHPNNTITIFDNSATDFTKSSDRSRGLSISLDLDAMTATLNAAYAPSQKLLSSSQGSVQILPDSGNVFVGWGHEAAYSEFTADGEMLCDVRWGSSMFFDWGWAKSYRAFKTHWVGKPNTIPSLAMENSKDVIYISWNGATEVRRWRVLDVKAPEEAEEDQEEQDEEDQWVEVSKEGFESKIELSNLNEEEDEELGQYFRVAAIDGVGKILAYSRIVNRATGRFVNSKTWKDEEYATSGSRAFWYFIGVLLVAAGVAIWRWRRDVTRRSWEIWRWRRGWEIVGKDPESVMMMENLEEERDKMIE